MILRAQIFISTVFAQPKFLPEGPLSPIIRKYICLYRLWFMIFFNEEAPF